MVLGRYVNGNYKVVILKNGTKIRETFDKDATQFIPEFAESMDVKITNYCDMNCAFCHEASSTQGQHGDILNPKFINTLKPFQEIACGGGSPTDHPDLKEFLLQLNNNQVIANMTVNQIHFERDFDLIQELIQEDLIKGLGISVVNPTQEFIDQVKKFPNAVLHVINGIISMEDLEKLSGNSLKVLILGYKQFRKGKEYYSEKVEENKTKLYEALSDMVSKFKVVSFDNLAIEQLNVKRLLSEEEWNTFYMGDDGKYTFYVDLVEQKYAKCSIAEERFDLLDDVVEMFKVIKDLD